MGIGVWLQDENGEKESDLHDFGEPQRLGTLIPDYQVQLTRLMPDRQDRSYVCLRFIDYYGDAVFNHLQMPDLLAELERIRAAARDEKDFAVLDAVRALAERCRDGIHLYLRFIGD